MITLILETSTEKCILILANKEKPLAHKSLSGGPELSKTLALEVKNLLKGRPKPELIAIGIGPGSYTGIRVGAALGKALAYGWKAPLLGFCSLKAFGASPILIDARMGGFYALLESGPEKLAPTNPKLLALTEVNTPDPELIKKRLPHLKAVHEKQPEPEELAKLVWTQYLKQGISPIQLIYLE
jgi:tRNA threonylcarbamoyl adenosine modification protein YeaZ